jgi:D-glycero-alpha-D-manno-heptose-7-phosphate kinase
VPSHGTGLGSSSSVTVGVLNALYAFQGVYRSPLRLAEEAAMIEIEVLGKPIGLQDQYAAAVGGFNFIEFLPRGGGVRVEPIVCPPDTLRQLQRSLLLFYTGRGQSAADVLDEQRKATRDGRATEALTKMRDLAFELRERLGAGDLDALASLLAENWNLKRNLVDGISDDKVDGWYERALQAGAAAGKLLGAGARGFLLVVAPPERHDAVRASLSDLREVPLRFAARGTHIAVLGRDEV